MIIVNGFTAILTPLMLGQIQQAIPNFPAWVVWPTVLLATLNVVFAIALFNWKKWGFFGFLGSAVVGVALNTYAGISPCQTASGALGIVFLYGVLKIGGEKSGWAQLD
jgi:hypothetical protein